MLLPALVPDQYQTRLQFDPGVCPATLAPITGAGEPSRRRTRQSILCLTAKQVIPAIDAAGLELNGANHLLARLAFQQVRPGIRSGVTEGQTSPSDKPQVGRVPATVPDVSSAPTGQYVLSAGAPIPPPVESLFTQLARRRLHGRATKEMR